MLCEEAHILDLRAEELLIALKQAWSHLAPMRRRHLGERDADALRAVVKTSIEVFFEQRESLVERRVSVEAQRSAMHDRR